MTAAMTTIFYHFGVEIEITAEPHRVRELPLAQLLYWEKLADALEQRDINVEVDKPNAPYRKNKERYTRGWWITRDGSLARSPDEGVYEAGQEEDMAESSADLSIHSRIRSGISHSK